MTGAISILTVDDSRSMRALLRAILLGAGFDVTEAQDGEEALHRLSEREFDLVITDINMPKLDGFAFIERLRGEGVFHVDRPILVLSTEREAEKKARARDAGATGWIVKPFDPAKLVAAIRRVMH